jgi:TolB-like protein
MTDMASLPIERWEHAGQSSRDPISGRVNVISDLPLADLTGDATQAYLADGFTDALITELARAADAARHRGGE